LSPKLNLSKFRKILSFDTVCFFWWGLLRPIQTVETRKAHHRDPEPSAARLGPRAFSTGVVDSLGEGFVCKGIWRHFVLSLAIGLFTFGVSWFIYPFFAKNIIATQYRKNGWLEI